MYLVYALTLQELVVYWFLILVVFGRVWLNKKMVFSFCCFFRFFNIYYILVGVIVLHLVFRWVWFLPFLVFGWVAFLSFLVFGWVGILPFLVFGWVGIWSLGGTPPSVNVGVTPPGGSPGSYRMVKKLFFRHKIDIFVLMCFELFSALVCIYITCIKIFIAVILIPYL
jgi:hypothetical protein